MRPSGLARCANMLAPVMEPPPGTLRMMMVGLPGSSRPSGSTKKRAHTSVPPASGNGMIHSIRFPAKSAAAAGPDSATATPNAANESIDFMVLPPDAVVLPHTAFLRKTKLSAAAFRHRLPDGRKRSTKMGAPKAYELLASAFRSEGVDVLFTLMGDGNMHWVAALSAHEGVRTYYVRHEHCACAM